MITAAVHGGHPALQLPSFPQRITPGKSAAAREVFSDRRACKATKGRYFRAPWNLFNFSSKNLCTNRVMFPLKSCLGLHTAIPATTCCQSWGSFGPGWHQSSAAKLEMGIFQLSLSQEGREKQGPVCWA